MKLRFFAENSLNLYIDMLYFKSQMKRGVSKEKTHRDSVPDLKLRQERKGATAMHITITGKNIDLTEGLKSAVEDKLGKLEKYFTEDTDILVTLSVEKERQKIEVTIPVKGNIIRSEQVSNDM